MIVAGIFASTVHLFLNNVVLGEDTFVVGETIMFGSSSMGNQVLISGNSTICDGCHIGKKAIGVLWPFEMLRMAQ